MVTKQICSLTIITFSMLLLFSGLLKDIPNAEQVLSSPPISAEDYNMIKTIVKNADTAVANIKIEHKEELVVPFQIPS
jgi:ragulator complex protein LAMTOR1